MQIIWDIIKRGQESWVDASEYQDVPPAQMSEVVAEFVTTFDPEHVALMEGVVRALNDETRLKAQLALLDYRREHGLV